MRHIITRLIMVLSCSVWAQGNYYQNALGLRDDSLRTALHDIIDNHNTFPYTSSGTDTRDILKDTDRDPNNSDNVILLYSGRSVDADQEYNNGAGWNREHVWTKSRGNFGTSQGAGTDAHHLRPCDISVNSVRGNRNFDDCASCVDVIDEGTDTGSDYDNVDWTFEPRDAVKGDVARMIFYMAVRYEGGGGDPDLELTDVLQPQGSTQPLHARTSTLLEWHRNDTVDNFEMNRNEVVYGYQGNRNPFVDHPELAEHLWGLLQQIHWNGQNTIGINEPEESTFTAFPNPTDDVVQWNEVAEMAQVFDLSGRLLITVERTDRISMSNAGIAAGTYVLVVHRAAGTKEINRIVYRP